MGLYRRLARGEKIIFSIILCSVVLRTSSLGGAALVHGLSDFLLMIPSLVLAGQQVTTSYVSSGEEGVSSIVLYLIIIACYLPMTIKAIKTAIESISKENALLKEQVNELRVKTGYYNYIDNNMPDSYKPTIQKLVNAGYLQGNEKGELMLTTDMMRILTILDRNGTFN